MKIGLFSDTHCNHGQFQYSELLDYDMLIFAGDCSNVRNPTFNSVEVLNFIEWFESVPVPLKIWIAGNHDTSIESKLVRPKDLCKSSIYLEHEFLEIAGLKIFGSPYTPTFGDWAFNKARHKLVRFWEVIEPDIDILITHGPPKGVLDLAHHSTGLEHCGDGSLLKKILSVKPKLHVFGHIHDNEDNLNQGHLFRDGINFVNASCVKDGRIDVLKSRIKTFEI